MLFCNALIHPNYNHTFFQVPPSAHHIIYLGTFFATFICHSVFVFLLEISVDNCQTILFTKSTTIHPSSFLVPAPYLPITFSSPMFPLPTCPFRSSPRTILFCFDTLSTHPGLAKNHFSPPCCCQPVEHKCYIRT